jgi:hypothetical protein
MRPPPLLKKFGFPHAVGAGPKLEPQRREDGRCWAVGAADAQCTHVLSLSASSTAADAGTDPARVRYAAGLPRPIDYASRQSCRWIFGVATHAQARHKRGHLKVSNVACTDDLDVRSIVPRDMLSQLVDQKTSFPERRDSIVSGHQPMLIRSNHTTRTPTHASSVRASAPTFTVFIAPIIWKLVCKWLLDKTPKSYG